MSLCLVTGGAGFIGAAISAGLCDEFDHVVAVDSLHEQVHAIRERPSMLDARVELLVRDILDDAWWDKCFSELAPSVVVHLAAETGTGQSLAESKRHASVNVVGLTSMLDAMARLKRFPQRIVLASSRAVYGEGAWLAEDGKVVYPRQRSPETLTAKQWDFPGLSALPMSSLTTIPHPVSIYGATKLAQEHILDAWAQSFAVESVVLRLQNVYGPGQSLVNPYTGIVALFAQLARAGHPIPIYEDGRVVRDFVFIDDVVKAILGAARVGSPSRLPYDIGSGANTQIIEVAKMIAAFYSAPSPVVTGQFRNGDIRHASCDISLATSDLEWTPTWSLQDGIGAFLQWTDRELVQGK
ncbi:NAD-dependent dehydratase [Ensifer adhaerens]|nr:NAD-dependent dehydratase [Ensifer adhaerens]